MIKYILSSCVPYLLRCLWVFYRYRVWRCYLCYHAALYPSFQQDKLVSRESCAAPLMMVTLHSAALCFGGIHYCFDVGRASVKDFNKKLLKETKDLQ